MSEPKASPDFREETPAIAGSGAGSAIAGSACCANERLLKENLCYARD
ncbi:hypothetical protein [Paracoccus mutanolyticus]|nr:hypothetical protein [Paracoccus mutanolyticus]